jgi:hypothetical protein
MDIQYDINKMRVLLKLDENKILIFTMINLNIYSIFYLSSNCFKNELLINIIIH